MAFWTLWWVWIAAALVLGILEVLAPGFVFLGFAVGALVMGALVGLFGLSMGLPLMLLIFAALSLISWLVMRRVFAVPGGNVKIIDRDIND